VRLESTYPFSDTLARVRSALEARSFRIFAIIDHRAAAQSVGLDMPQATVLIYGDPRAGTPMMVAAPDFALELPLRLLVREDEHGKTYVTYNSSADLEGKHGLPKGMAEKFAGVERIIVNTLKAT
jgi:uncharacterized protein (DUF302 family)